jgi:hypothetical protein
MSTNLNNNNSKFKITPLNCLVIIAIISLISTTAMSSVFMIPPAFGTASDFILRSSQQVYVSGDTLNVYGAAEPNEVLLVRLFDPAGLALRIESVRVADDGFFQKDILVWPEPSRNMAFGTYTAEAISSLPGRVTQRIEFAFAEAISENVVTQFPVTHALVIKLDAPGQVTVGREFRIFAQVTFDGALVDAENDAAVLQILGSSHIHSDNSTIVLSDKFKELHPGLYYADVTLDLENAYIIHVVAFHKGFLSHDSRVVSASASSISTIQESVDELNAGLDSTNRELGRLEETLSETKSALNTTEAKITSSVDEARASIREEIGLAQQASGQINSIILPVLALISIIIALQISLFARIRASYK